MYFISLLSQPTDQVALPEFGAGAMENWGLITYLEGAILVNPMYTTMVEEEQVVITIAHELAHQVFLKSFMFLFNKVTFRVIPRSSNDEQ